MRNRGLTLATLTTIATLCALAGGMLASAQALAAPIVPTVTIKAPTGATSTTAHVSGTVNPNGGPTTVWNFQYSKDPETEGWIPGVSGIALASEEVTGTLEELQPNAIYDVRLVATNEEGGEGISAEPNPTFKTLAAKPEVSAGSEEAYGGSSTTMTLEAQINPNNQPTTYVFEYATKATGETLEGTIVKRNSAAPLEGFGGQTATIAALEGLSPGTTYFYRVVAKNATGATDGPVQSFTTVPTPTTDTPDPIATRTATLTGHFTLDVTATQYSFTYQAGAECTGAHAVTTTPVEAGAGTGNAMGTTPVTELEPNTQYAVCLETSNAYGTQTGEVVTFATTVSAPAVDLQSASEVGPVGATLNAQIDAYGIPTTYHFEYVTASQFQDGGFENATSVPAVDAELGDVNGDSTATVGVTELRPETEYHYRVVTANSAGTTDGPDQTFRTVVQTSAVPDHRIDEPVTPVENHDADIYDPNLGVEENGNFDVGTFLPFQASKNGDAIAYAGDPTPGGTGSAGGGDTANEYVAMRTASGWIQQDVSPRGRPKAEYEAFSPDLSVGILLAGGNYLEPTALLSEAPNGYKVLYAHNDTSGETHALFTSFYGGMPEGLRDRFAGGTEGFETVLLEASAPLTEGAPAGNDLYEETAGRLSLVSVLPDGIDEPEASFGAPDKTEAGSPDFSHDISEDGRRIFWTGLRTHALYMHEDGVPTLQLDASQAGGSGGGGQFWTASTDGSKVFFTDDASAGLTTNTVSGSGTNLNEYEVNNSPGVPGHLVDLTSGSGSEVQGVIGVSASGGYVYFVANGVLASGAKPGACQEYQYGVFGTTCNLYVDHEGKIQYIASLSGADGVFVEPVAGSANSGEAGDWSQGMGTRTSEVTPSGEAVTFMSNQQLTAYDNQGTFEVYVYDATTQEVQCASCDPTGAALQPFPQRPAVAAVLPISASLEAGAGQGQNMTRTPHWLSSDGDKVFFDSFVPLVPRDTNGRIDVYEWERDGAGECTLPKGCVYILSGGKSNDNSYLFDASETGSDVFFVTRAQLSEADRNENMDVYDAREDGSQIVTAPACTGSGCQGVPPAPPSFATPASSTFNGAGNFAPMSKATVKRRTAKQLEAEKLTKALRRCRKDKKKGARINCERTVRRRYGGTNAKKTSDSRRTGR